MVVFLVATKPFSVSFRDDASLDPGFIESWIRIVKGEIEHVELAFVTDEGAVYGFWLTFRTKTVRFEEKRYDKNRYLFYKLNAVDYVKETELMSRCMKCAQEKKVKMSPRKLMASAFPFYSTWVFDAMFVAVNPEAKSIAVTIEDQEVNDGLQHEFCASICAKMLRDSDLLRDAKVDDMTANDLVLMCKRFLGAEKTSSLLSEKNNNNNNNKVRDAADIVRSEEWLNLVV